MTVASKRIAIAKTLSSLQVWQLKRIALNIGTAYGPNKTTAVKTLVRELALADTYQHTQSRYKSVDMGVKNLAYCSLQPTRGPTLRNAKPSSAWFRLHDWQRLNLLRGTALGHDRESPDGADVQSEAELLTTPAANEVEDDADDAGADLALRFSPANLAPVATKLALSLIEHEPSIILIERQRFRSGSGSAVQEWTLRVNSLEAMLWAALNTIKETWHDPKTKPTLFKTFEMSPARIASFWNARGNNWSLEQQDVDVLGLDALDKPKSKSVDVAVKRGMEKSEKIALVRHWLESGDLDVDRHLQPVANAFMRANRQKKTDSDLNIGKKDDLADCVVQGVTFGIWERNRRLISTALSRTGPNDVVDA